MASESTVPANLRGQRQALNKDYSGSNYDKGHLVPVQHRNSQECVDATFTLTNAAPQNPSFNRGQWRVTEANVEEKITTDCLNLGFKAYIVTGVVPGNTQINNRVNVPNIFWSAYCCVDNNNMPKVSGAYYGYNVNTRPVQSITAVALDALLTTKYGTSFTVFPNHCQ